MGRKAGELLVLGILKSLKSSLRSFYERNGKKKCYKENVCLHTVENLDRLLYNLLVDLVSSIRVSQRRLTDVFFKKKKGTKQCFVGIEKIALFGKERQENGM